MIILTQGDALDLTLTCSNHDLTGATITTRFQTTDTDDRVIPNDQHTIDPDQSANKGKYVVSLTAEDTEAMAHGIQLDIITKVVQGSAIVHFRGTKILTVKKATLR